MSSAPEALEETLPTSPYDDWKADPSQAKLKVVVDDLKPSIDYALRQIGGQDNPYLRNKARVIAADAVGTYNPQYASLPTWTTQQLIKLRRVNRQSSPSLRIPERMQLDNLAISQAEKAFHDEHDREPDVEELSDLTSFSIKRIQDIRRTARKTPSETALDSSVLDAQIPDHTDEALEYLYGELDYTDRKILEMKTGYGGKYEPMAPALIATTLNLSPTQLSRRSTRLGLKLQKIESDLQSL